MADVNLGVLAATTLDNYHSKLVDNIFKKHALLDHLRQNGGTKTYDGGRQLVAPLMYGTNSTVKTFSGTDELDVTYQDGIDASEWTWRYYNVAITFTLEDKSKNRGKSQIVNLLKSKIRQAELSLAERLNTDLFTGTDADKEVLGLDTIIGTTTEVGGISGTSYAWWRSTVNTDAEAVTFADMRSTKNSCNLGNGGSNVSIIITTQALYEKMFALLTATYSFNQIITKESRRMADASFEVLEFEGVPVTYDESATSGVIYFINKDNYKLGILDGYDFVSIDKGQPANQHVDVAHIVFAGAAYTDRRASLGKHTAKTA